MLTFGRYALLGEPVFTKSMMQDVTKSCMVKDPFKEKDRLNLLVY